MTGQEKGGQDRTGGEGTDGIVRAILYGLWMCMESSVV
jgi:hypothetical protein